MRALAISAVRVAVDLDLAFKSPLKNGFLTGSSDNSIDVWMYGRTDGRMVRNGRFRRFTGEAGRPRGMKRLGVPSFFLSLFSPPAVYTFFFDASSQNTWDKRGGTDVQPGADGHQGRARFCRARRHLSAQL